MVQLNTVGTNKQLSVRLRRRKNRAWCSVVRCHALSPAFVRMTHHSLLSHGSYIKRPLPSDLCLLYFRAAPSFTSLNTLGTVLTLLCCVRSDLVAGSVGVVMVWTVMFVPLRRNQTCSKQEYLWTIDFSDSYLPCSLTFPIDTWPAWSGYCVG